MEYTCLCLRWLRTGPRGAQPHDETLPGRCHTASSITLHRGVLPMLTYILLNARTLPKRPWLKVRVPSERKNWKTYANPTIAVIARLPSHGPLLRLHRLRPILPLFRAASLTPW